MRGAVGIVPLEGRGGLPHVELQGEPMFVHPVRALRRSGCVDRVVVTCEPGDDERVSRLADRHGLRVEVVAGRRWWTQPRPSAPLVLTDPLCPLVPAGFLSRVVDEAGAGGAAGYRPVTDTVKTMVDRRIAGTLDRDRLVVVVSPVVIPAHLAAERPPVHDFALVVAWLRAQGGLTLVAAPSMAHRVSDEASVGILECREELRRSGGES